VPVDLVIDHSVIVDNFGNTSAFKANVALEYERNLERYQFLRWGQMAFDNFRVVPPGTGICHQVNLEYLAQVVWTKKDGKETIAYPDTLVGTDSHTTMVNGLGVLGWGVGGIEAEAAMLGQPYSMVMPEVIGFRLNGKLKEGVTATDLVLTVTELLRKTGVVGKFVEYFGPGIAGLALADRATIGNMSPEYGATCGFFPVDDLTLAALLRLEQRAHDPEREHHAAAAEVADEVRGELGPVRRLPEAEQRAGQRSEAKVRDRCDGILAVIIQRFGRDRVDRSSGDPLGRQLAGDPGPLGAEHDGAHRDGCEGTGRGADQQGTDNLHGSP